MKKYILLLLLATFGTQAQTYQNPTYGKLKLKTNTESTTATKVNVQEVDGTINTISKSDLVNVVEVNDVPSLPLIGEAGKIYVVKNVNKIYRWNGTFYPELSVTDIGGKEDIANKQNSLAVDGTNTKYPTVTAVNTGLALKANLASPALTGTPTAPTPTTTTGIANKSYVDGLNNGNVKLTGDQAIAGQKSFTNNIVLNGGVLTFLGASSLQTGNPSIYRIGNRLALNVEPGGKNVILDGNAISSSITLNLQNSNGTLALTSNPTNLTATSFIKPSAPTTNILLAGGGDIAQNTAFNKNFGTTAGTVAEGNDSRILNGQTAFGWGNHVNGGYAFTTGSNINQASFRTALGLGSNAYTSTAYLPTSSNIAGTLGAINVYGTAGVNSYLGVINIRNGLGAKEWRLSTGIETETQEGFGIKNVTDNNHPIWILNGGNVGIGTTTPTAKLDVYGTFKATGEATFASTVTAASYTATSLPVFENNAAASSLAAGQFYRTSTGVLMVKF